MATISAARGKREGGQINCLPPTFFSTPLHSTHHLAHSSCGCLAFPLRLGNEVKKFRRRTTKKQKKIGSPSRRLMIALRLPVESVELVPVFLIAVRLGAIRWTSSSSSKLPYRPPARNTSPETLVAQLEKCFYSCRPHSSADHLGSALKSKKKDSQTR